MTLPPNWCELQAADITEDAIPEALGVLGRLQGQLLSRLVSPNSGTAPAEPAGPDRLLDVNEMAEMLGVTKHWLYRNSKRLPFAHKLTHKVLRFSEAGAMRWVARRSNP